MPTATKAGIVDANHALLVGMIAGVLMGAQEDFPAFEVDSVLVEGDYTNEIIITRPSGVYRVKVDPI